MLNLLFIVLAATAALVQSSDGSEHARIERIEKALAQLRSKVTQLYGLNEKSFTQDVRWYPVFIVFKASACYSADLQVWESRRRASCF